MKSRTNWRAILDFDDLSISDVKEFASGEMSGRQFYEAFKGTEVAGEVRAVVRSGVNRAKECARKALSRHVR